MHNPEFMLMTLTRLALHYPQAGRTPAQLQVLAADWAEDLAAFPQATVDLAVRSYRRRSAFFPAVADIVAECEALRRGEEASALPQETMSFEERCELGARRGREILDMLRRNRTSGPGQAAAGKQTERTEQAGAVRQAERTEPAGAGRMAERLVQAGRQTGRTEQAERLVPAGTGAGGRMEQAGTLQRAGRLEQTGRLEQAEAERQAERMEQAGRTEQAGAVRQVGRTEHAGRMEQAGRMAGGFQPVRGGSPRQAGGGTGGPVRVAAVLAGFLRKAPLREAESLRNAPLHETPLRKSGQAVREALHEVLLREAHHA